MKCHNIKLLVLLFLLMSIYASAQSGVFENLQNGPYNVGFKIISLADESRVVKPMYNYLGELDTANRERQICIQMWYPASAGSGRGVMTFEDYATTRHQETTLLFDKSTRENELNDVESFIKNNFGPFNDTAWQALINKKFTASKEAEHLNQKFPLLIGMLRPLSTSLICEYLASHGYVVAMVKNFYGPFSDYDYPAASTEEIRDMQFVINYLNQQNIIDVNAVGSFGYSGSGFTQILFGMHDYRIKALADIESAIFAEGLWQRLASSNYYRPEKLRIPFMHIYSKELAKLDKHFDEFGKMKFSKRYHLILNQEKWHHWNVATEGYLACTVLKNRGEEQDNIQKSYEIASIYLLNFFDTELKGSAKSATFLSSKPVMKKFSPQLWDINVFTPFRPAPDLSEFEHIIKINGIKEALFIVSQTIENDASVNLRQAFLVNRLGYDFLGSQKFEEAIGIFKLNTELHPDDAGLFDSLAEAYELAGDKENMKKTSRIIINLLAEKVDISDEDKLLKNLAEKRLKQ